jgi:hypothetical protein
MRDEELVDLGQCLDSAINPASRLQMLVRCFAHFGWCVVEAFPSSQIFVANEFGDVS